MYICFTRSQRYLAEHKQCIAKRKRYILGEWDISWSRNDISLWKNDISLSVNPDILPRNKTTAITIYRSIYRLKLISIKYRDFRDNCA